MNLLETHAKNLAWIDEKMKLVSISEMVVAKTLSHSLTTNRKLLERHAPKLAGKDHYHPDWAEKIHKDYYICSECIRSAGFSEDDEFDPAPCSTYTDITEGLGIDENN